MEKSFIGKLGAYTVKKTEDNSLTLWSSHFDENCHSLSGAVNETIYNYLEGAGALERMENASFCHVFEVGFGVGIGPKLTINKWLELGQRAPLVFVSTELDSALVDFAIEENSEFFFKELSKTSQGHYLYQNEKLTFLVLIGDARKTIKEFQKQNILIDSFYQDAFSPKKNPALWTVEWFKDLKKVAAPHATLSTYSASNSIRKSLQEAGWAVFNRKGFGTKRAATLAKAQGESSEEIIQGLARSPVTALADKNL